MFLEKTLSKQLTMNKTILLFLFFAIFAFGRDRDVLSVSCDAAYVSILDAKCAKPIEALRYE
jgi:hypothetical protein